MTDVVFVFKTCSTMFEEMNDKSEKTSAKITTQPVLGSLFLDDHREACPIRSRKLQEHRTKLGGLSKEADSLKAWLNDEVAGSAGLLLTGPSGCGKTSLVRQVACDWSAQLIEWNGSQLLADWPDSFQDGDSSSNAKEITKSFRYITELFRLLQIIVRILFLPSLE